MGDKQGAGGGTLYAGTALLTLYFQLQDPVYRHGVYAVAVWYVAGLLYFALAGRHRLILSPEEEFANKARTPRIVEARRIKP